MYPQRKLSYSSLKNFIETPASYIEYIQKERDNTKYSFASFLDAYLCNYDELKKYVPSNWRPLPNDTFQKKENKIWKDEQNKNGKIIAPSSDYELCGRINKLLNKNPTAKEWLKNGVKQQHAEKTDPATGLKYHGYGDILHGNTGIDIKQQRCNPRIVNRLVFSEKWYLQAAIYRRLFGLKYYYLLVVESEYNFSIVQIDEEVLDYGDRIFQDALFDFKNCLDSGIFGTWDTKNPTGEHLITLPDYLRETI